MTPTRTGLAVVALLTALVLQPTAVAPLRLPGGPPQLVVVVLVVVALLDGPFLGAVAGFCSGLACDLLSTHLLGQVALVLTIVGWGAGKLRDEIDRSVLVPLAAVAVGSAVTVLGVGVLGVLTGQDQAGAMPVLRAAGAALAYDLLLTPFVFPALRGLWLRLGARQAS